MFTLPSTVQVGLFYRNLTSLVIAGAVPAAAFVAGSVPVPADPSPPAISLLAQHGSAIAARPVASVDNPTVFGAIHSTGVRGVDAVAGDSVVLVGVGRHDAAWPVQIPVRGAFSAIDRQPFQARGLTAIAASVATKEVPENSIRIGSFQTDRPEWLSTEQGGQVNDAAASAEAGLARTLDSAGFESARSDRIASDVLGSAAVGTAVGASAGSLVASPIAAAGAIVGVVAGLAAGLPFAPIGLVIVPVVGAAIGYAMVAAPFVAVGALVGGAIGAAVGAATGAAAPLVTTE